MSPARVRRGSEGWTTGVPGCCPHEYVSPRHKIVSEKITRDPGADRIGIAAARLPCLVVIIPPNRLESGCRPLGAGDRASRRIPAHCRSTIGAAAHRGETICKYRKSPPLAHEAFLYVFGRTRKNLTETTGISQAG